MGPLKEFEGTLGLLSNFILTPGLRCALGGGAGLCLASEWGCFEMGVLRNGGASERRYDGMGVLRSGGV